MMATSIKEQAKRIVDELPETATWDDLIYHIQVRQEILTGLQESLAGDTVSSDEVRRSFGLSS